MPPSEIRKEAREALKGKWGKAALITFVFLAVSIFIVFFQSAFEKKSIPYYILEVLYLVINIPLSFGLLVTFIKLKRNENIGIFSFFKEAFTRLNKSFGIWFYMLIKVLLPIVCLVLLVILHFVFTITNANVQLNMFFSIVYIILLIATIIYVTCRLLLYVLAYCISFDNPELSSKDCVLKSAELMKGHRGNYFMLLLSFIGWMILGIIAIYVGIIIFTLLLGLLGGYIASYITALLISAFTMIYVQFAAICFYERVTNIQIKKTKKTKKVEE